MSAIFTGSGIREKIGTVSVLEADVFSSTRQGQQSFPLRFHFAAASGGHCASLQVQVAPKDKEKRKKNARIVSVVCFLCALFPFPHHLHDCQHSAWQCQLAVYRLTCRLTIACPHFLLSFSGAPRGMTLFPLLSLRILSPLQNL